MKIDHKDRLKKLLSDYEDGCRIATGPGNDDFGSIRSSLICHVKDILKNWDLDELFRTKKYKNRKQTYEKRN